MTDADDEDQRIGREAQPLPAPVARTDFDTERLRPTEEVPIPATLYLEGAGPAERRLLWQELDSLIEKVKGHGERSLSPSEFCLYELMLPMFKTGSVNVAFVRRRAGRKFGPHDETFTAFEAACHFVMKPGREQPNLDQIENDRIAAEARRAASADADPTTGS